MSTAPEELKRLRAVQRTLTDTRRSYRRQLSELQDELERKDAALEQRDAARGRTWDREWRAAAAQAHVADVRGGEAGDVLLDREHLRARHLREENKVR